MVASNAQLNTRLTWDRGFDSQEIEIGRHRSLITTKENDLCKEKFLPHTLVSVSK